VSIRFEFGFFKPSPSPSHPITDYGIVDPYYRRPTYISYRQLRNSLLSMLCVNKQKLQYIENQQQEILNIVYNTAKY
jgi:hypothetical protein